MKYRFTLPKDIVKTTSLRSAVRKSFPILLRTIARRDTGWLDTLCIDFIWATRAGRRKNDITLQVALNRRDPLAVARTVGAAVATMDILGVSGHPVRARVVRQREGTETGLVAIVAARDSMLKDHSETRKLRRFKTGERTKGPLAGWHASKLKETEEVQEAKEIATNIAIQFWDSYMETYAQIRAQGGEALAEEAKSRPEEIITFVMDTSMELVN